MRLSTGFYYHYKHDPNGPINNYAYEVIGIGHHTESDCRDIDKFVIVYRPLYASFVYRHGRMFDIRPMQMFTEKVMKDGKALPRFKKIRDTHRIAELKRIKKEMYSE